MTTPQSMTPILTRIEESIQRVVQAIAPLSTAALVEPRLANHWSVKDLLAHLTWWDQWLLVTIHTDEVPGQPPQMPPLFAEIPPTQHWAEEMNAKVYAYNRSRPLGEIQEEFTQTRQRLLERVARLSLADLYDPNGLSARIGQPVAPLVLGIYEHYEEHAHQLAELQA